MPVTVNHVLTATTPDNTSYEIRPSHWNSAHSVAISLATDEVIKWASAAGGSISSGTLVFSNSNGVSFGMNAGTVTASHNGLTTAAASNHSHGNPTLALTNLSGTTASNSAGLTLSLSANSPAGGTVNVSAGTTSNNLTNFVLSNSNGVSFGLNGSTVTASHNGLTTAAQSNHSHGNPTLALTNLSGTTASNSAGLTLSLSANAPGAATLTVSAVGNTTVNSSGTWANALSLRAYGILSAGTSNGSLLLSTPDAVDFTQLSVGNSNLGNTAGDTGVFTGRVVFVGTNNITLSGSSNGGSATISISGASGGGAAVTASAANGSYTVGNLSFSNANGISFGTSAGSAITASHNALTTAAVSNHSHGFSAAGGSSAFQTLSFSNGGGVSFTNTNGQVGATVATTYRASNDAIGLNTAQSNVTWTVNSSGLSLDARGYAGTGTSNSGGAAFTLNSNGLAFNGNSLAGTSSGFTGANISASITHNTAGLALSMSVAAPGAAAEANPFNLLGANTAGNTTATGSTIGLSGINLTLSGTNNSVINISAPATSSLSATGQVSISTNGSTISIGVPPEVTLSRVVYPPDYVQLAATVATNNSISFNYLSLENYASASAFQALFSVSANTHTSASTNTWGLTMDAGVYTRTGSTLSRASSGSQTYSGTYSTNSTASLGGVRVVSVPMNASMTPGEYWFAMRLSSSSVNASMGYSIYAVSGQNTSYLNAAHLGEATNTSHLLYPMNGMFSVTSGALPSSVTLNEILGSGTQGSRANFYFDVANYTLFA